MKSILTFSVAIMASIALMAQTPTIALTAKSSVESDWNKKYDNVTINVVGAALANKKPCGVTVNEKAMSISSSDSHWIEISCEDGLSRVVIAGSGNSSGTTDWAAPLCVCSSAPFDSTIFDIIDIHYTGYDKDCQENDISLPAGTKSVRLYRRMKVNSDKTQVGSGSNWTPTSGTGNQTFNITYLAVYAGASAPVTDPISTVTLTGPNAVFIGQKASYTASTDKKATAYKWTVNNVEQNGVTGATFDYTPSAAGTYTIQAYAKNEYNTDWVVSNTINLVASEKTELVQVPVSAATVWDFTKAGTGSIEWTASTTPQKDLDTVVLANIDGINNNADFNSQALRFAGQYPIRDGKYCQGPWISFKTTVAGYVQVDFSNTGTKDEARYIAINGVVNTEVGTKNTTAVTSANIAVPAGDVVIEGSFDPYAAQYLRIYKINFSTDAPPVVLSSDATLKSIVYGSDQTPVPNFSASQLSYEVELPSDYVGGAPSVQAEANHSKASVSITQATTLPGTATIDVTAEDGTTKLQYSVTFTRASANPKVLTATWDNIEGTATIDQVNKTITGQVKNGSSLILTPTFSGNNIKSWFPDDATDFSNGAVDYVFSSPTGPTETYWVTITEAAAGGDDPTPSSGELHFWFFHSPDATENGVTNDATVFSEMAAAGSNMTGSITIDGKEYKITKRTADETTFGKFTIPAYKKATFYALAVSSGDGARQINLIKGDAKYELFVEGGSSSYKQIEQADIPSGTYTIGKEGTANVRLGVVVLKISDSGETPPEPVAVESVTLNKTTLTLEAGQTETLTATVKPDDAENKNISWSSDNTAVATVDANGKVSALTAGTANIVVKTEDQEKTDTCVVTVTAPSSLIEVESISIKTATTLKVGDSETLSVTYTPANANTGKAITWTSDAETVAAVNANGKVTGVTAGTAVITATSENGKTATCTVTVNKKSHIDTDLDLHDPEKYEAKEIAGGYNTPLTNVNGHEYEVYYTERTASEGYPTFSTTLAADGKSNGISGSKSETKNEGREGDKWFKGTITSHSECKSASDQDEFDFESKMIREHRLGASDTYQFHVQGFDQFSLWGMDKKLDPKNGNQVFVVKVDGVEQPTDESLYDTKSYTIRRYDISTEEHLIEISTTCTGSNVCYMGGFSLRVAQEPRTKYLKGNDSTQSVLPYGAIRPVTYVTKYNNVPGAETKLEWIGAAVDGLTLQKTEGELTDTLVLKGTANAPAGKYKYAVVAYLDGKETSRAEGTFSVYYDLKALTETDVDIEQDEEMDEIRFRYNVYDESTDIIFYWSNTTGIPGITTSAKNGTFIISGTPTQTVTCSYLITAEGCDTIRGTIRVESSDLGVDPVLYLYKSDTTDYIYKYLKEVGYNLRRKKTKQDNMRSVEQYAKYKWILISEDVDANNREVSLLLHGGVDMPILNMKAFSYSHSTDSTQDSWGEADNGSLSENGKYITVWRDDHPIFKAMNKKQGDRIQVLDSIERKGLMPIKVTKEDGLCLATAMKRDRMNYYGDGDPETFMHEIPNGLKEGYKSKYICFPVAKSSSQYLSDEGKNLLKATIDYLLSNKQSVSEPEVRIVEFKLGDIVVSPAEGTNTIVLEIDTTEYPELADLTEVVPEITLASPYTFTIPAQDSVINLSYAPYMAFNYVVSDYIHREVYNVKIVWRKPQGIEEVYSVGQWVNVYDMFGRKVATTNEDIYTMSLPRGVYIIVTENGQTLKISR